ncbi:MAG: hypothetical protein K5639_07320 [Eubacterium sp.]|nr:hypothetical protein [Eubacterium sp.]
MADGTKTSKEADIAGYNRIYRNDNSSDKDTITITSIAHHDEYSYGLKTLGGKVITGYVEPTVEGGATYGTVQFTDLDLYTTYYLVAKRKDGNNDNSSEIVIPYVGFEKEWIYDGTEQSLTPTDYRVNEETSELTNGADYEMVTPDIAVNRADPYEQLFPDNVLAATEIGSYKFTLKYKAGSDYATSGYVTRSWKIQQLPPAQGGNVSPPVQPSKPDPSPTPVAPTSSSTHVVLSNGKFIKSVSAPGLSGYTDEQQGQKIEVKLTVKEENEKDIDKSIVKKLNESVKSEYSNVVYKGKVHVEYTDMTVTRRIDDGEPEIIPDVNRVLEIEVDCDLESKYEPVVVREHGGEISAFKKLDEKPTDEFEDGSYFVDAKNNKIWVYARFFSKYSIAYLTKSQVVSVNPKTTATPKPSDSNKSNDSGGSGSGKVSGDTHEGWQAVRNPDGTYTYVKKGYDPSQPKTGDDAIPIIWIWMLMLGTGVVMMSYLVSKKIRKDEEK